MKFHQTIYTRLEQIKIDEKKYKYLYNIPPKSGRYIVLDTETTGLHKKAHMIELGAHEIINGKLTGIQFHIYIKPRELMSKEVINIHKIKNDFYEKFCKSIYESDKNNMENFLKFIGNSIIFAHNAPFDMNIINNELNYWKLQNLSIKRFRCTMRIFYNVVSKIDLKYSLSFTNLGKCCEYFNIKSEENNFHNALFDAFMTARMICEIYDLLDKNKQLRNNKGINYTTNSIDCFLKTENLTSSNFIEKEFKRKKLYKEIHNKENNNINIKKKKIKINYQSDLNGKNEVKNNEYLFITNKENINQLENKNEKEVNDILKYDNDDSQIELTQKDINFLCDDF
jgi:DNA polymerase-3 subunit epsilon